MSFPVGRIEYRLNAGRMHVILMDHNGVPLWCGGSSRDWPFAKCESAVASITMTLTEQCDHGGTHREPRSLWTGEPAATS